VVVAVYTLLLLLLLCVELLRVLVALDSLIGRHPS
jgi:hypothetical protein